MLTQTTISLIKIARPTHWVKNFSIFAALIFSGTLFIDGYLERVIWAFVAFCFAASATYIFNDIADAKQDRMHPKKKERPIAARKLSIPVAVAMALVFIAISLAIASSLNFLFLLIILFYLLMQAGYSLGLKNVPIIDILIIATGFVVRVYAGAVVIDAHLSVWFLLCVVSASLFLASGKRRSEFNILENTSAVTRKSLTKYKKELLNSYVTMFANAAWMSWALFTFFESPQAKLPVWLFLAEISKATTVSKLLMITIPVVIFGIMRYESLIFQGKSEVPEKLILSDKALMASAILWMAMVMWVYYGNPTVGAI